MPRLLRRCIVNQFVVELVIVVICTLWQGLHGASLVHHSLKARTWSIIIKQHPMRDFFAGLLGLQIVRVV